MLKIPFYSEGEFEGPNGRTWEICQKHFLWARKRLEIHKWENLSHGCKICGITKNRTRKYFESHFLAWIPPKLKIFIKFQSQPPTGAREHINFSNIFRGLSHESTVFSTLRGSNFSKVQTFEGKKSSFFRKMTIESVLIVFRWNFLAKSYFRWLFVSKKNFFEKGGP